MSITKRVMATTPDRVWSVLSDGWLYPLWVVGASRIREVKDGWPGRRHADPPLRGAWPLLIDDNTEVLGCEADRVLGSGAPGPRARRSCGSGSPPR